MPKINQPSINARFVRLYAETQQAYPFSTAGVARIASGLISIRASAVQISNIEIEEKLIPFTAQKLADYFEDIGQVAMSGDRLVEHMQACKDLAFMAIVGAAVGYAFPGMSTELPEETYQDFLVQSRTMDDMGKIRGLLDRAYAFIRGNHRPESSLSNQYIDALRGEQTPLFKKPGGIAVQQNRLMEVVGVRLERGFRQDNSPQAEALVHNLLIQPGIDHDDS